MFPVVGPPPGGHTVTIDGSDFLPNSTVSFICNGVSTAAQVTSFSTTQLEVTVPVLELGPCDVEVRWPDGLGTGTLSRVVTR